MRFSASWRGTLWDLSLIHILKEGAVLVSVSKGIERDTNLRMSQLLLEETKGRFPVTALSGPSHAEEVSIRLPTGCVAAGESGEAVKLVQDAFMNLSLIHI